ncbi:MAG: MFS transporter [Oscillospiraceae bacterium]|nr:MFS transporter [Oscillospiraceae bacterium]
MKKLTIFKGLRNFLILWSSQSVSNLGTSMTSFALIAWVYSQTGTALSITLLTVCTLTPSVLFSFIAGTLADRLDKKRIMLLSDLLAAVGTAVVMILFFINNLQIRHVYIINFLLSFMNAFQAPASYAATTLLVPKEQYVRASGFNAFSGSVVTILAPALGGLIFTFGGLQTVLIIDLAAFAVAFSILLVFIKIPKIAPVVNEKKESFLKSCTAGIHHLRKNKTLFRIILFFAFINFIAKMGSYGMLPVMILSRTGGNQISRGITEAAVGIGMLTGSVIVTLMKPVKSRIKIIFFTCGISFLFGDLLFSFGRALPIWAFFAFAGNLPLPFLGANLTAIMRTKVPVEMQGRVFAARDTIQYSTIPVGLLLGGLLADRVFEPFMETASPVQQILSFAFGAEKGSGLAVMFFIVGMIGFITSFVCLRNPKYRELD